MSSAGTASSNGFFANWGIPGGLLNNNCNTTGAGFATPVGTYSETFNATARSPSPKRNLRCFRTALPPSAPTSVATTSALTFGTRVGTAPKISRS